jgi:hypothetical protein
MQKVKAPVMGVTVLFSLLRDKSDVIQVQKEGKAREQSLEFLVVYWPSLSLYVLSVACQQSKCLLRT